VPVSPSLRSAALTGLAVSLLLAGCTQKSATGSDNPVVSSSPAGSAPLTSAASSSSGPATPSSPAPATSTSPVSSSASATPQPTATIEKGGCPTSALSIRAIRGSGAAGHEFAFVQFSNTSTSSCTLTGYPGIQLLLAGKPLGAPAVRTGKAASTVSIAPGTSVTAGITDDSTCNAAISDSVQVIPPNRTDKVVVKLQIRGCTLHVDPVAPS